MKICVFIPVYNAESTILETLDSIDKSAEFNNEKIDVYIQDDCSSDNTVAVLKKIKSEWLNLVIGRNEKNLKERKTTNIALFNLSSTYDWVLIIHADDIAKKEWIFETKENILLAPKNCFTVWSSYDSFDHDSKEIRLGDNSGSIEHKDRTQEDAIFYLSKITSSWHISGCALNLALFVKVGGFKENLAQYGDTVFFVDNILSGHTDTYIRKTLTKYRIISSSVSFNSKKSNSDIEEILFLVDHYLNILNGRAKKQMYFFALRMIFKRFVKNTLKLKLKHSYSCLKLSIKIFFRFLLS